MTIHSSHPFAPPPEDRAAARRLRGLLPSPVTVWTSAADTHRDGWTISSFLVANGDPAELVALVSGDAEWWDLFRETSRAVVNVLAQGHGQVADVFARTAPSPGGVFRTGEWEAADDGPRLASAAAWIGVGLIDPNPEPAGWGLLVRARIDWVEIAEGVPALEHRNGRYR